MDISKAVEIEYQKPANKHLWIPMRARKTKNVGIIFTKNSLLMDFHIQHGTHHDWGNVAAKEAEIELEKIQSNIENFFSNIF